MTAEPPATVTDQEAWLWAQNVISEVALNERIDEATGAFMVLCRQFHQTELARMHLSTPTEADIKAHKRIVTALIGAGTQILGLLTATGEAEAARRVNSRLIALKNSFLSFHSAHDPEKITKLYDSIFNAPSA